MPLIRPWSRVSNIRSVRERGPTGGGGLDTEALQEVIAAPAAGLQPDLVEPQDVFVRVGVGSLADLVQGIDHRLEVLRELAEHLAQYPPLPARHGVGERGVGMTAHGDVVVDVDELARKTLREESRDEEGDITETLQAAVAILRRARLEGFGEHDYEGLQTCA